VFVLDEEKNIVLLFNVTCPVNTIKAAAKKYKNHCILEIAIKNMYNPKKIQTVPIVIDFVEPFVKMVMLTLPMCHKEYA